MKRCPKCGNKNIYIGANEVECPTSGCPNFSEKQYNLLDEDEIETDPQIEVDALFDDEPTNPNFVIPEEFFDVDAPLK